MRLGLRLGNSIWKLPKPRLIVSETMFGVIFAETLGIGGNRDCFSLPPDPCAAALSRVQHQLDQALPAFTLQVLSQAVSELASAPPERFQKQPAALDVWNHGRKGALPSLLSRKVSRLSSIATTVGGSFDHKQMELKGIRPVLVLGVVSRNAGESGAGPRRRWCDRCPTAKAETTCTSAAGQGFWSRTTFDWMGKSRRWTSVVQFASIGLTSHARMKNLDNGDSRMGFIVR